MARGLHGLLVAGAGQCDQRGGSKCGFLKTGEAGEYVEQLDPRSR